jgi:ketopantoate reductase
VRLSAWKIIFHDTHGSQILTVLCCKVTNQVPDVSKTSLPPFDYIVCTTKNCPDIKPTLSTVIGPGVTPGHTVIVLIQNGLNIEKPLFEAFPRNVVLSGISMIDCHEVEQGHIIQEFPETLILGPFRNPNINLEHEEAAAEAFITMYAVAGKTRCLYCEDVPLARWKKLVFNSCFNPICAITGLDVARARLADGAVEGLLRPAMVEIIATAKALGHMIPEEEQITSLLNYGATDSYLKPSMQTDAEKVWISRCMIKEILCLQMTRETT